MGDELVSWREEAWKELVIRCWSMSEADYWRIPECFE